MRRRIKLKFMTDQRVRIRPVNYDKWLTTYYDVNFYCSNCGKSDYGFMLPKGIRKKGIKIDCKNCGCEGELN